MIHYRSGPRSEPGRRPACGVRAGCLTVVLDEVSCQDCRVIWARATLLARECRCRNVETHLGIARAQIELEAAEHRA